MLLQNRSRLILRYSSHKLALHGVFHRERMGLMRSVAIEPIGHPSLRIRLGPVRVTEKTGIDRVLRILILPAKIDRSSTRPHQRCGRIEVRHAMKDAISAATCLCPWWLSALRSRLALGVGVAGNNGLRESPSGVTH